MEIVDLSMLVPKIVVRLNAMPGPMKPPIHLSILSAIEPIRWRDGSLEWIIRRFLINAMSVCNYRERIRMEVCEKSRMKGLEMFFALPTLRWISFSIGFPTQSKFVEPARGVMESLGYRCCEWIGSDNWGNQLGVYSRHEEKQPELVLYLLHGECCVQCDLLIPVFKCDAEPIKTREAAACIKSANASDAYA